MGKEKEEDGRRTNEKGRVIFRYRKRGKKKMKEEKEKEEEAKAEEFTQEGEE